MTARVLASSTLAVVLATAAGWADDDYRYGYVRTVEPGVTLQRAAEAAAESAVPNLPFLPGDRVWTDEAGRLEVQFADGTVLRLDSRSKLDYVSQEGGRQAERVVLRLWSGALFLHNRGQRRSPAFSIETPEGVFDSQERGAYRIDVSPGRTRVAVLEGEATVEADRRARVARGEQVLIREGALYAGPERLDAYETDDDFARWDAGLEEQFAYADGREEWLPEDVSPYAGDFAAYGSWQSAPELGYVWYPTVDIGWSPYSNGYWAWTVFGWTWVPNERWGWATSHYGRWGFNNRGWYWRPSAGWGPGWVSWSVGRSHVGWCPLGWGDRPVIVRGHRNRGNAVPRGSADSVTQSVPWRYVRRIDMGQRDLARRRVDARALDTSDLQVAAVPRVRPTRDLRLVEGGAAGGPLRAGGAVPRNVRTNPGPGDTVPELRSDPMTTIRRPIPRRHREPDPEPAAPADDSAAARARVPGSGSAWRPDASGTRRQQQEAAPPSGANRWPPSDGNRWNDRDSAGRREWTRPRTESQDGAVRRERSDRDREPLRPLYERLQRPRPDEGSSRGDNERAGTRNEGWRRERPSGDDSGRDRGGRDPGGSRFNAPRPERGGSDGGSRSSGAGASGSRPAPPSQSAPAERAQPRERPRPRDKG